MSKKVHRRGKKKKLHETWEMNTWPAQISKLAETQAKEGSQKGLPRLYSKIRAGKSNTRRHPPETSNCPRAERVTGQLERTVTCLVLRQGAETKEQARDPEKGRSLGKNSGRNVVKPRYLCRFRRETNLCSSPQIEILAVYLDPAVNPLNCHNGISSRVKSRNRKREKKRTIIIGI